MPLILCEGTDAPAHWLAEEWRGLGTAAEVVTVDALGDARRWEHRVDRAGATVRVELADGRVIDSAAAEPIVNRLSFVPLASLRAASGADYGYAAQEVFAFYLSWLSAWPAPVLNRPTPQGLGGQYRHGSIWALLGAQAGLATAGWSQSSDQPVEASWAMRHFADCTVFVVSGRVLLPAAMPGTLEAPCRRLGELAETGLLGMDFRRDAEGWTMVGASPMPHLIQGGPALAEAILAALGR